MTSRQTNNTHKSDSQQIRRRHLMRAAGGALATAVVATPATAQTNPRVKWRLASSWPKSLDTIYGVSDVFARRVAEITDNRFQIQVFAAGEIVPAFEVLDAVQSQSIEMGYTATIYYTGKEAALVFGGAVPFGLNTRQTEAWLIHGGGNDLIQELLANFSCYGIAMGNTGCQMGGWFRREISKVEDLRGLKFRIAGLGGRIISKLGVVPQQIPPGDIYPALEKGIIDAIEFIGPHDDEKLGFHRIAKYYYYPAWWEGSSGEHVIINLERWNSLPRHYQAAVQAAAREAGNWMVAKYDAVNPPALRRLVAAGAQLRPFSPEIMDACYKAANEVYAEIAAANPRFKKIYDNYIAFRSESYLWWQVAEMSFDLFQARVRTRT